jgi:hypothetical protein
MSDLKEFLSIRRLCMLVICVVMALDLMISGMATPDLRVYKDSKMSYWTWVGLMIMAK